MFQLAAGIDQHQPAAGVDQEGIDREAHRRIHLLAHGFQMFADVGGLDDVKREIRRRIITPFLKPSLFQRFKRQSGGGMGWQTHRGKAVLVHILTLMTYVSAWFFPFPPPPGASKQKDVRYLDIHEVDVIDEALLVDWVAQASRLPGVRM